MERTHRRLAERFGLSRAAAGCAALVYPMALIGVTLGSGFRSVGDLGETASSVLGALLFLIAAPTAWVFAIEFIDVSRFTVLMVGTLTSLPLWYLLGTGLTGASRSWAVWLDRYVVLAALWTFGNVLLFGLIDAVTG